MSNIGKRIASVAVAVGLAACMSGCGTSVSKYTYNDSYKVNTPVKDEKCYDSSVVLGVDAKRAKDISVKLMAAYDADISAQSDTKINAQRNRHLGVVVGSGGEELEINLKPVDASTTFVTVTTKVTMLGAAGQKAWSCEMIDKMVEMSAK